MNESLAKEAQSIRRGAFKEAVDRALVERASGKICNSSYMDAMDVCSKMAITDDFRYAYDYLSAIIIKAAPTMARDDYLEFGQTIYRMASYMHRFDVPRAKLPSLYEVTVAHQHLNP